MKKVIVITGDLASGKTTLANNLAKAFNIPYFAKDHLKENTCDIIGFKSREDNHLLSRCAVDNMLYIFKQCAQVGLDLILEANFRKDDLLKIQDIAKKYNYHDVYVALIGDSNLLYQRFVDRLPSRHLAHTILDEKLSLSSFSSYNKQIREQFISFSSLTIDVSAYSENEVKEKAKQFIEQELFV